MLLTGKISHYVLPLNFFAFICIYLHLFKEEISMIKLLENGAYLLNGTELIEDSNDVSAVLHAKLGSAVPNQTAAAKGIFPECLYRCI